MNKLIYFYFSFFLCIYGYALADEVKIKTMNSSGLYVEELASLRTYYTEWKLVTYINLTVYNLEYIKLHSMISLVKEICISIDEKMDNDVHYKSGCNQTLMQINDLMLEIEEHHSKWFLPHKISKRGIINPIGNLQRALFGTLDNTDAEFYLKEFEILHHNDNLQNSIIKNQTSLIQSTINMMGKLDSKINVTISHIEAVINRFIGKYESQTSTLSVLKTNANELFIHVTLTIIQFMHNQKIYLNAISLNQNNGNNPNLIPPKLFYNELKKIHSQITAMELDLPLQIKQENLATFYQISLVESKIIKDQLIVSFTLPLVNTKKYILYKSTSLPVLIKNNLYSFIVPHHEYVALDSVKDKYIPITNDELKACFQISETNLICKETFPIMSAIGTSICEINLLRMDKVSDECNIRIANFSAEIWIKLRQPNSYVFTFPKRQFVYISCPLYNHDQFIEGTGVIYLEPGCNIKTNNLILHTFQTITTVLYRHITPIIHIDINITQIVNKISVIENFHIPEIVYPSIINYGEQNTLESISLGLKDIQEMEQQLVYKLAPQDLRNNISTLFITTVVIMLVVLVIYIRYIYKKSKKIRTRRLKAQCHDPIEIPMSQSTINIRKINPSPLPRNTPLVELN